MSNVITQNMTLESREEAVVLFGPRDQYLRLLRDTLSVRLIARGDQLMIEGTPQAIDETSRVLQQMRGIFRKTGQLTGDDVRNVLEAVKNNDIHSTAPPTKIVKSDGSKYTRPRTDGQARYVEMMKQFDLIMCVGPAGTGKTYLAVGWAVQLLRSGQVQKIVLVRPAVEAGERLGFLPGDLIAKINPYLRPLFDSLNDIMEVDAVARYMESGIIEILPLAYMRGRTLNNACIILDEGQNATVSQMKMFLTRMGHNSKIIVTGDTTQTDLPRTIKSGMADAVHRLKNIEGIGICYLEESDIVRNPLVQKIVNAYDDESRRLQPRLG